MKLATGRFFKGDTTFGQPYGKKETHTVYSYETGNAIYDVMVFDGTRYFRKNGRSLRNGEAISPIHFAIIKHFNVSGVMSNPRRRKSKRKYRRNPRRRSSGVTYKVGAKRCRLCGGRRLISTGVKKGWKTYRCPDCGSYGNKARTRR